MHQFYYWILGISFGVFLLTLLAVAVGVIVILPFQTRRQLGEWPQATFTYAPPELLSTETRAAFATIAQQFQAEEFAPLGTPLLRVGALPTIHARQVLVNGSGDVATIALIRGDTVRWHTYTVRSTFEDGTEIATVAQHQLRIPAPRPKFEVNFGWVPDAHTLCEIHRRRLANLGLSDAKRRAPGPGDYVEHCSAQIAAEQRHQVETGYFWYDKKQDLYRLTWKAACLFVWKNIPPIAGWLMKLEDAKARKLWRELGMHQWRRSVETAEGKSYAEAAAVAYEPQLAEGEVRTQRSGDTFTVRIGAETRRDYLMRQWLWLAVIVTVLMLGTMWLLLPLSRPQMRPPLFYLVLIALTFIGRTVVLVVQAVGRRGLTTLTASPAGMSYRNIPQWRGDGHVTAEEVQSFAVQKHFEGLGRPPFRLVMQRHLALPRVLARGIDQEKLEQVIEGLRKAMGLQEPITHRRDGEA